MKLSKLICNESHQAFGFNMKKNLSLRGGVWLERVKIFEEFVATLLSSFNKPGKLEMFYLHSILNFGIPPVLVFQLEVY